MTHRDDGWDLIDWSRSAHLDDDGAPGYSAATVVDTDGQTQLIVAQRDRAGDNTAVYDTHCSSAHHEQTGPLPLDVVRRIAITRRQQRRAGGQT